MPKSEPASSAFSPGSLFSTGSDIMRENAEQMRKISDTFYDKGAPICDVQTEGGGLNFVN